VATKAKQKPKAEPVAESGEEELGKRFAEGLAAAAADPPWTQGPEITAAQLEEVRLRASRDDFQKLVAALQEHGSITVV